MKGQKEIIVLFVLLAVAAAGVLLYVINRRATIRARPPAAKIVGPLAPTAEVDLKQHDRQTIDFSSGKPVVSDTPEDRAALAQGLKEIEEAKQNVTFEAEKKPAPKRP